MKREYLPHEKTTTKRSYKAVRNGLLAVIVFLLSTFAYVETHKKQPEVRKIHYIWEGKGWIDSLNTFTNDLHCRSTPNKD